MGIKGYVLLNRVWLSRSLNYSGYWISLFSLLNRVSFWTECFERVWTKVVRVSLHVWCVKFLPLEKNNHWIQIKGINSLSKKALNLDHKTKVSSIKTGNEMNGFCLKQDQGLKGLDGIRTPQTSLRWFPPFPLPPPPPVPAFRPSPGPRKAPNLIMPYFS